MVHKLKYDGWTALGAEMAARIAALSRPWPRGAEAVLVPVPLGRARRRARGFNQSEVIAAGLSARWSVPVAARALHRTRETSSQVRLTPEERSANVHAAFAAGDAVDAVRGKHAVLVDDVVTTAATLNACAAALVAAGALTLSYVTFGRARAAFDRGTNLRRDTRCPSASASTASAGLAARCSAPPKSGALPTSISLPSTT
jgi:ComF family protein